MNANKTLFCENCGERLVNGASFCEACGHAVEHQAPSAARPAAQRKDGRSQTSTYVIISIAALVVFVILLVILVKPGNLFKREDKDKPPVAAVQQDLPSQQQQPARPELPQDQASPPVVEITPPSTSEPISMVSSDRSTFYCISSDGPTTLTIMANASADVSGLSLSWRLNTKKEGRLTEWEGVYMDKTADNQFSFTFDADVWEGTNNFYYPPLLGESWFEYQLFVLDGSYQTEIYKDVTFFPCAQ